MSGGVQDLFQELSYELKEIGWIANGMIPINTTVAKHCENLLDHLADAKDIVEDIIQYLQDGAEEYDDDI